MSQDERREHERLEYVAQISLRQGDAVSTLPVRNISAGGIYVGLNIGQTAGVDAGETVSVFFDAGLDEFGDSTAIHMEAEVVRVDHRGLDREAGIALMWTTVDPDMVRQLAQLLAHLQR